MSSSSKERFYVPKSRRSSPGDSHSTGHHGGFFPTGQGRFSQCNVLDQPAQPDPFTYTVPATYNTPYTQPRSAINRLSYDLDPQALYGAYTNTSTSPQFPTTFPNYEIHHHERYSPQPSYPAYPTRSTPPIMTNQGDSRRLPPLSTSSPPPGERWPQPAFVPQPAFPATNIRSPTATYPPSNQFMQQYPSSSHQPNAYHYPMSHPDLSSQPHSGLFDDVHRIDPRSNSPFRNQGSSQVPPPQSFTPPPISPTSPEEPTVKKKRRRADANQLKVLNETYARTAFPSTEERVALAKLLDMSARSVQIWFQNKRQAMRQTNRQANSLSHTQHPYSVGTQGDSMTDELVAHPAPGYDTGSGSLNDALYLPSSSPETSRHSHAHSHQYGGYHSSRHRD